MQYEVITTGRLATNGDLEPRLLTPTDERHHNCKPVEGVGINDMVGSHCYVDGKKIAHPCYVSWASLLKRSYSAAHKENNPQRYAEVADEWKKLSGYYDWWREQPYYPGGTLDSDLLSVAKGLPKAYTPETATFVPHRINTLLIAHDRERGELPQGVRRKRGSYQAQLQKGSEGRQHLGRTDDMAEALDLYWSAKLPYALTIAYELLEGHPQRDDLMIGIKETLRQQHEESMRHLYDLTQ